MTQELLLKAVDSGKLIFQSLMQSSLDEELIDRLLVSLNTGPKEAEKEKVNGNKADKQQSKKKKEESEDEDDDDFDDDDPATMEAPISSLSISGVLEIRLIGRRH